jgi:drug/metabolite transporter (DMT)-like permease
MSTESAASGQPDPQQAANRRGILLMSAAMALFLVNDALVKRVSEHLPGPQLICVRGLFATGLMLVICWATGSLRQAADGSWPAAQLLNRKLLVRAVLDAAASLTYLTALFHLPLANGTAINMATPLFVVLFAAWFFHEHVSRFRWLAVAAGFVGVMLIVQPRSSGFNAWALVCLAGTLLHAVRDVVTRIIPTSIPSMLVTLSTVAAVTLFAGIWSLLEPWQPIQPAWLAYLAAASVLLAGGYYCLIRSMRAGEMSLIAPFRYSALLFAIGLGWWMWREIPNALAFVGIGLLVAAGLAMLLESRWRQAPVKSTNP